MLLLAVEGEVQSGKPTPAKARKLLEPYRKPLSVIYAGEQRMIYDPRRERWSRPDFFPSTDDVRRNRPASAIFWYEADDLGIPGVGFTMWATRPTRSSRRRTERPCRAGESRGRRVQDRREGGRWRVPPHRGWREMGAPSHTAGLGNRGMGVQTGSIERSGWT